MNETLEDQVRRIIAGFVNVPPAQLSAEALLTEHASWDSFQQLSLVLELESRFGVHLRPEHIEQMQSLGSVVKVLDSRLSIRL